MARMRKAKQVKTPLFDRIFKPQMITLANGHSVARPRSRVPLITGVLLLSVFVSLYVTTKFDFTTFISKFKNFTDILKQVFHPTLFQFTPSEDYFAPAGRDGGWREALAVLGMLRRLDGRVLYDRSFALRWLKS